MMVNILSYLKWLSLTSPLLFHVEKGVYEATIYRLYIYLQLEEVVVVNSLSNFNFRVSFKDDKNLEFNIYQQMHFFTIMY